MVFGTGLEILGELPMDAINILPADLRAEQLLSELRAPGAPKTIRISHSNSNPRPDTSGIPEIMCSRILMCRWSFGAIYSTCPASRESKNPCSYRVTISPAHLITHLYLALAEPDSIVARVAAWLT